MRLDRWLVTLLLLVCAGCSSAPASSEWDSAATASLEQEPVAMLRDIDAGNFEAMLEKMDSNPVAFDIDENGKPVKAEGMDGMREMFGGYEKMAKEHGFAFKSTLISNKTYATTSLGYCLVEFDQTITAGGQTMGPFKFRGTLIARKVGNDWKWTHWHGSYREMPAMAEATPPTGS